ncbi:MAG: UbiX family flavin prenyltransferase [Desulfitobacteriaceae bacterium]
MGIRKNIVVGISGASGAIYGVRLLEALNAAGVETHLVISPDAERTIQIETPYSVDQVRSLGSKCYDYHDVGGAIASGSYLIDGMIIAPCSIKTLSAVANSYNDNLLVRAGDVCLKEKRKLVLMVRETPLHLGHLRLLTDVAQIGAIILPPIPAFYHLPESIDDLIKQTVGKVLDQFQIEHKLFKRWKGNTKIDDSSRWPELVNA